MKKKDDDEKNIDDFETISDIVEIFNDRWEKAFQKVNLLPNDTERIEKLDKLITEYEVS